MKSPRVLVAALGLVMVLALAWPLLAAVMPATVRIPKKNEHPKGTPPAAALFSHRTHAGSACYVCHPSIFPMEPWAFDHKAMNAGRACGACHDGQRAAALPSLACGACHVP